MAKTPSVLREDVLVSEALRMFKDLHVDQMPVIGADGNKVVGAKVKDTGVDHHGK